MLLRRILMRNKEKLAYFGVVCGRQGFISRLGDAVSEFFAYGVTPDDIKDTPRASLRTAQLI